MKEILIEAFTGSGDSKTLVGSDTIPDPETLEEAIELEGGKDKLLARWKRQKYTDTKNRLRAAPTGGKKAEETYIKCLAANVPEAVARSISSFVGTMDTEELDAKVAEMKESLTA